VEKLVERSSRLKEKKTHGKEVMSKDYKWRILSVYIDINGKE
jgi:hypothetical protein